MAKHKIGKQVSKGQRISGGRVHRKHAAIIVQAERVATAMREALLNIKVEASALDIRADSVRTTKGADYIVDNILIAAKRNAGNNTVGRGWTANLSPRTVRALTEQGVFA